MWFEWLYGWMVQTMIMRYCIAFLYPLSTLSVLLVFSIFPILFRIIPVLLPFSPQLLQYPVCDQSLGGRK